MERRTVSGLELRADSQNGQKSISGYSAKWNRLSEKLGNGSFREMLLRGTFTRSLQSQRSDVTCLVNHDPSLLLGRQRSGTLRVREDSIGLHFRCSLPDTTAGNDAFALIQRGDIAGCSFAFVSDGSDTWSEIDDPEDGKRIALRTISRANLLDCSIVTNPAYSDTSVDTDDVDGALLELNNDRIPMEVRSAIQRAKVNGTGKRNLLNFILQ